MGLHEPAPSGGRAAGGDSSGSPRCVRILRIGPGSVMNAISGPEAWRDRADILPADAVIATDKLTGYLIVARPLDDKSKFLASAGFTQSNYEILEAAIRNLATVAPAEEDGGNEYGIFWRVAGRLQGPTGTLQVVTVWLQWDLDGHFRFITLKPLRK